jgi:SEC-C motif-containing protein
MPTCPCGSLKIYETCCKLYLEDKQIAKTPEQLMRSRYTAYALAKTDYIKQTMQGKPLIDFNEEGAKQWAQKVTWLSLKVIQAYNENPEKGFVEFVATFIEYNKLNVIHELSEFNQQDGRWFYVDGVNKHLSGPKSQAKIGRNSSCPCGSGKKFKNCHEK